MKGEKDRKPRNSRLSPAALPHSSARRTFVGLVRGCDENEPLFTRSATLETSGAESCGAGSKRLPALGEWSRARSGPTGFHRTRSRECHRIFPDPRNERSRRRRSRMWSERFPPCFPEWLKEEARAKPGAERS